MANSEVGVGLKFHVCALFKEILAHIGECLNYSKPVGLQTCCRNKSSIITCDYSSVTSCDLEGYRPSLRSAIQFYVYCPYKYVKGGYLTV